MHYYQIQISTYKENCDVQWRHFPPVDVQGRDILACIYQSNQELPAGIRRKKNARNEMKGI